MDKASPCIVFCGHRSSLGLHFLEALEGSSFEVKTIVLATEKRWQMFDRQLNQDARFNLRKAYRRLRSWLGLRKRLKAFKNVSIRYCDDVNDPAFLASLKKSEASVFFCAAYPQLFGDIILSLPENGCINIHPSLLPAFAGAHPHFWAIRNGAEISGITAHRMTETIDEGAILAQVAFSIQDLNYAALYQKIGKSLPKLLELLAQHLLHGRAPVLCNQGLQPSRFRNNRPKDSEIRWQEHRLEEIRNIIRTGTAFFRYRKKIIRVLEAHYHFDEPVAAPGTILKTGYGKLEIAAIDGILQISRLKGNFPTVIKPGPLG